MIIGELISLGTAFFWTFTVIGFEYAGKRVGSLSVNILRLVFGLLFLTTTVFIMEGSLVVNASQYEWSMLLISGLIGLVIGDLFLFQSFVDIGGRIALLIYSSVPIMTALLGYIIFDETFSVLTIIGMMITLTAIGVVILSKRDDSKKLHPKLVKGIVFAFIGALAQAIGLVFSKLGMSETVTPFAATQMRVMAAIVGFVIYITILGRWGNVKKAILDKKAMKFIILGSIFGPFLGVASSLAAMNYTAIGVSTTIAQLNVILIIPFSVLLFKEKVNIIEIIGAIFAFIGVTLLFLS
jgi:drug/metabolite transporter (DMT)-like permease